MMQTMTGDSGSDGAWKLPSTLDLAAAEEFLATMRARAVGALELDASGVEVITLPCAQIILSAAGGHSQLAIRRPSESFVKALVDLGLSWPGDQEPVAASDLEQGSEQGSEQGLGQGLQSAAMPLPDQFEGVVEDGGAEGLTGDSQAAAPMDEQTDGTDKSMPDGEVSPQTDASGQQQTDAPAMSKRILTIDDSKTMRDMLLLTLTDAGFEVLQGVDGEDGLAVLGDQKVDVIITDINMPKMDGYEVIRQLRQNPRHKTTPILVLTTESDSDKRTIARSAGATGWMVKPFDPEGLIAVINKVSP
jgi:two-component system, chemotaxis family, chemotaxis protein CheY